MFFLNPRRKQGQGAWARLHSTALVTSSPFITILSFQIYHSFNAIRVSSTDTILQLISLGMCLKRSVVLIFHYILVFFHSYQRAYISLHLFVQLVMCIETFYWNIKDWDELKELTWADGNLFVASISTVINTITFPVSINAFLIRAHEMSWPLTNCKRRYVSKRLVSHHVSGA